MQLSQVEQWLVRGGRQILHVQQKRLESPSVLSSVRYCKYFVYQVYRKGRLGIMPGSVHWVRLRKKIVIRADMKKRSGTAGLMSQMSLNRNMKQGIRTPRMQMYTQMLAQVSESGPIMQPKGRNRFFPGHASYSLGIQYFIILHYHYNPIQRQMQTFPKPSTTKKMHKILYIVILMAILYGILFYLDILNYLSLQNVVSVILGFLIMIIVQLRFISYYFEDRMKELDLDEVGIVKDFIRNKVFGEINLNYISKKQKKKYYQHTKDQNDRLFTDQNQETFDCVMATLRSKKTENDNKNRLKTVQEKWDILVAKITHFEVMMNNLHKLYKEKHASYKKFTERTVAYKDEDIEKWRNLFSYVGQSVTSRVPNQKEAQRQLQLFDVTNWLQLKKIIYVKMQRSDTIVKQILTLMISDFNTFAAQMRTQQRQVTTQIQASQTESSGTKKTYRDIMEKIKGTNEKINNLLKKINQKTKGSENTEQIFKTEYDLRFLRIEMDNLQVRKTYTKDMMVKNSENNYKLCMKKENVLEHSGIKKLNNKISHYIVSFYSGIKAFPQHNKDLKRSRNRKQHQELLGIAFVSNETIKPARENLNQYYRILNQFRYYLTELITLAEEDVRCSKKIAQVIMNYNKEWKTKSAQFKYVQQTAIGEKIVDSLFVDMIDSFNKKQIEVMGNFIAHLKEQHMHIPSTPKTEFSSADISTLRKAYDFELSNRMTSYLPEIILRFLEGDHIIFNDILERREFVKLKIDEEAHVNMSRIKMNEYKDQIFRLQRQEEFRREQQTSIKDQKQLESHSLDMINRILDVFAQQWKNSDFFHEILKQEIELSLNTKRPPFLGYMFLKYIKVHEKQPKLVKNLTILGDNVFLCNFEIEIDFKGKVAVQIETQIKNNRIPIEIKLLLTKFKCPLRISFTPFCLGKSNMCMMKTPELEAEYSAKINGFQLTKIPFLSFFIELFVVIKLRKKFLYPKKATIKVPMAVKNAIAQAIKQRVNYEKLMQKKKKSD